MQPDSPNSQPSNSRFGESTIVNTNHRLRTSLEMVFQEAHLQTADATPNARRELRSALRQICEDARHSGLRAEQLLVLIKDVWSGIPAGISRVRSMHGDERLNYVISTCVDEYYGNQAEEESKGREHKP
ncbi:MAG TPA: hypothetical protein VLI43_17220 [Gemmatimonadaceae bacterium]|nr:hypothetical protein [Gemmatimonadaceae bacterium]